MKTAIFPGSFNPWHDGHTDILNKALAVFDKVVIVRAINSLKDRQQDPEFPFTIPDENVSVVLWDKKLSELPHIERYSAVIRGLRNTTDFEYEKALQYNYEDMGLHIPIYYVISDRQLVHKSSSAIRAIRGLK